MGRSWYAALTPIFLERLISRLELATCCFWWKTLAIAPNYKNQFMCQIFKTHVFSFQFFSSIPENKLHANCNDTIQIWINSYHTHNYYSKEQQYHKKTIYIYIYIYKTNIDNPLENHECLITLPIKRINWPTHKFKIKTKTKTRQISKV